MEDTKFLVIPNINGVAMPAIKMTCDLKTPYLQRASKKLNIGDKVLVVHVADSASFDDPAILANGGAKLVFIGTFCTVEDIVENEVLNGIKYSTIHIRGESVVALSNQTYDEESQVLYSGFAPYDDIPIEDSNLIYGEQKIVRTYDLLKEKYPEMGELDVPNELPLALHPYYFSYEFGFSDKLKVRILRENNPLMRFNIVLDGMKTIDQEPAIDAEISSKTDESIQRGQREYILRERAKAIKNLLKEYDGDDIDEKYDKAVNERPDDFPPNVLQKIKSESSRLKLLGAGNQEASVVRNYLDLLIKLPWKVSSKDNEDIPHVKEVLDEDHYGLEKQKDRILEYLAVKTMTKSLKAPILCLYGPPGVGKTSLAISVAKALNRKFVKFALGGIYDESEIRGHRRTYIGALPGRIITGIANAGTNNPVFLLDEIDKVSGGGIHGDPAAALLELLDPEQNINFEDNYLAMPFDLSNVLFICTANDISQVPAALRDRLELIELNTYTLFEKMNIAKKHLLKQEYELNGLNDNLITFEDDAIEFIIDGYTREAGVRELRRKISTIMRKFSVKLLSKEVQTPFVVTKVVVEEFLNKPIFHHTRPLEGQVGIVNGLAYTSFGGEILPIECNITEGTGQLIRTGNLGDVMKESMQIAFSYVQELAQKYGYGYEYFSKHNFHIHCPEGAVPKDGPSAGVALSLCLLSAITGIPVSSDVAMTGEVDLRGRSMPIGGLREKTLAAVREHMRLVLIPKENHNDYLELPDEVKNNVEIKEVESVEDVVKLAFVRMPEEKAVPEQKKEEKASD